MPSAPLTLALLMVTVAISSAADIYVSITGSNSNPGTIGEPQRDIDYAADRVNAGDTIIVRGGTYNERLTPNRSGTAANRITIKNFAGESAVIDGAGISVGGQTALVDLSNRNHITLQGFQIRNLTTTTNSRTPIGILIQGASTGIQILDCEIYSIRNNGNNGNAHGVLIQGTSSTPISDLLIQGNEIRDLVLGNSEAMVLNGNVDGFEVIGNHVHDCNNLGIDFIGFEGNGPAGLDQARNGICRNNTVTDISTLNNPAYGEYSAGGIYVDGGRDIIIEGNQVARCDIGIEVASEAPGRTTSNITVRNNIVWNNSLSGVLVGGYDSGRGAADNCTITGNTIFENDRSGDYSGEIQVQFNTSNLSVRNNIVVADEGRGFVLVNDGNNSAITLDYNLYYSLGTSNSNSSGWLWHGDFRSGFNSWKSASGQDANSTYADPQLSTTVFTIASNSPARDDGDPAYSIATGETDAFGQPRLSGSRVDIGAHEFVALTNFQQWRQFYFNTTSNSGEAADLSDPDEDGLANLLEFALAGQDPILPATTSPTNVGTPGISFAPNPDAHGDLIYQVEGSPDLASWSILAFRTAGGSWSSAPSTTVSESQGTTSFSDFRPGLSKAYFYRLSVTNP